MVVEVSYIKYGNESVRQVIKRSNIDNVNSSGNVPKVIILIHGGAWRDVNNTCNDFDKFVEKWDNDGQNLLVYSIDYKVSSEQGGKFPQVVIEVLKALEIINNDIINNLNIGKNNYNVTLVGHSVGCTFITQIMEYENFYSLNKLSIIEHINSLVFLEGIYDMKLLHEEYPDYDFFVIEEFENVESAIKECNNIGIDEKVIRYTTMDSIIIVHSHNDELLSLKQPQRMVEWLKNKCNVTNDKLNVHYGDFGLHNEVYENISDVAQLTTS